MSLILRSCGKRADRLRPTRPSTVRPGLASTRAQTRGARRFGPPGFAHDQVDELLTDELVNELLAG